MIPINAPITRRNRAAFPEIVAVRTSDGAIDANALVKLSTSPGTIVMLQPGDSYLLAIGVAITAATGVGQDVQVVEVRGIESQILSDGTTSILVGDVVQSSATVAGRIMKGTTRPVGVSNSNAAATPNVLVSVIRQ